jgi:hypothetical protein
VIAVPTHISSHKEKDGKEKEIFPEWRKIFFVFNDLGPVHTPLPPDRGAGATWSLIRLPDMGPNFQKRDPQ